MRGFDNLNVEQRRQLVDWFMYRIKADDRRLLASHLPEAYNAWVGREVVQVEWIEHV